MFFQNSVFYKTYWKKTSGEGETEKMHWIDTLLSFKWSKLESAISLYVNSNKKSLKAFLSGSVHNISVHH